MFNKILVANRGEIAIRVMRAANELGKKTVAVYAEEDKLGLHRFKADEAYRIGAGLGPVAAYLSIPEIIRVARESGADAIHPGYGLLSENPDFVDACVAAGIAFIGPTADTMRALGDKASARRVAIKAGVPVIPATEVLGDDMDAIKREAAEIGYPLMLKASWGGGGRGMRPIQNPEELPEKVREGRREAEAAFGNGEGYLEKMILRARHVEVQLLGDSHGGLYHLYERDCTVQRRNQKVVERAPAPYLTQAQRDEVCGLALKIGQAVGYRNAGTVEFLMDMDSQAFYFIEVNPRVQVEHTVTEEVTGIDIVQSQIQIAEGATLAEATGVASQAEVRLNGHALQCRVTTEDPLNNFIPDYGRIAAYRSATGNGIRLDGGTAYSGGVITRYYDSLLVKVTAHAQTPDKVIARMDRALREFRVRGVATNIEFVINLLKHPTFLDDSYTTKFIDTTPDLFQFDKRQDRATRILTYIADISVNGHPETAGRALPPAKARSLTPPKPRAAPVPGTRQLLEDKGAKAVADWMLDQKQLLITDTSMRDGHQSLLATRMRSIDMIRVAPSYAANLPGLFSVECWGGATFDVAYRFLQECPWQRLRDIRARMPNLMTQMLLRASNGVGYTNYPDNVVQEFVRQAAETGVDVFRVFDSLNWVENMRVAMDAVVASGKICEGTICYTGDILDPQRAKYDLQYYIQMGHALKDAGAHVLGLKDMAGLLKPASASLLVRALKDEIGLPVHFHTHDTGGIGGATILAAANAGVDAVDCAMDALSGNTSQPTLGSIVEALRHTDRDTGLDIAAIREISNYWEAVREQYAAFESGLQAPASEVYLHEMPGGQFTNLKAQARSLGLEERWHEVAQTYAEVNQMFGDIVKVTPSSKVVGDMALMMVAQGLTRQQVEDPAVEVAFPDSVVDMMKGNLGQPPGGWPEALQKKILKGEAPMTTRPGAHMPPVDLEATRQKLAEDLATEIDDEDLNGYLMYPKVFTDYMARHATYGPVRALPTRTFFYGMEPGQEIEAEIDPGKTLEIRLQTIGDTDENGDVRVFFDLNGQPRVIRVPNRQVKAQTAARPKADPANDGHVGAPMPGVVASVAISAGQKVSPGDLLLTIEAMKMETGLHADREGTIKALHVSAGQGIDAKDLLVEIE
ncbi:pyruvate carboxylase [Paracoccus shanxieyensis]|uniref:Pyruvate carboxylase n=1 Tax=Paracoccus shanxieyensis TaxID=2675752 RepID=A0A6L6IWQ0_9RHOB|nr:pyruvate carboxylase [Paracoccus shanxieyensis]MTH64623.1 pyruvate carboxylase [Paracoccus shanxieyensis]MTH87767.1 pyruvate carboxylase [Paracoccus shanxieyensis]